MIRNRTDEFDAEDAGACQAPFLKPSQVARLQEVLFRANLQLALRLFNS